MGEAKWVTECSSLSGSLVLRAMPDSVPMAASFISATLTGSRSFHLKKFDLWVDDEAPLHTGSRHCYPLAAGLKRGAAAVFLVIIIMSVGVSLTWSLPGEERA